MTKQQTIQQRVDALRQKMKKAGVDYYLVPTADFHNSEYVGNHFKAREYISGFSGSAGTALIGKKWAGLWTDGRYFLQASQELEGTPFELMKQGEPNVPTITEFLEENLKAGQTLAFDGRVVPFGQGENYLNIAEDNDAFLKTDIDLIDTIWEDRPSYSNEPVFELGVEFAGESVEDKIQRVRRVMKEDYLVDSHIITTLDDIGWLLNIRGNDVKYSPLVLSYAIIFHDHVDLYIDQEKVNEEITTHLNKVGVELRPYNQIYDDLNQLEGRVLIDPDQLNFAIFQNLPEEVEVVTGMNPSTPMKAIKNETELKHMVQAQIKDGVAHVQLMRWLKEKVADGSIEEETEISANDKLDALRTAQGDYISPSFEGISGFGPHGAIIHYSASSETNSQLHTGQFLLMDTGANYLQGSTDITRTYALGEISEAMKEDFTTVLQSHLRLSNVKFLKGVTGSNVDIVARQPFWQRGLNFNHGTGHGIGYLLNIHEGPIGIRWQSRPGENNQLLPGMVVTNEPGIYRAGEYGIRIEVELVVRDWQTNEYGTFYQFETITYVPIDLDAIKVDMLSDEDRTYLNDYHELVYNTLSPHLKGEDLAFLKYVTRKI